jgi:hypothetical protein
VWCVWCGVVRLVWCVWCGASGAVRLVWLWCVWWSVMAAQPSQGAFSQTRVDLGGVSHVILQIQKQLYDCALNTLVLTPARASSSRLFRPHRLTVRRAASAPHCTLRWPALSLYWSIMPAQTQVQTLSTPPLLLLAPVPCPTQRCCTIYCWRPCD